MTERKRHNGEALPKKVLIVDDHPTNRKLLRVTLEAAGVEVYEAVDGAEALTKLDQQPVEAVISDLLMPNMDGYQLCHELRRGQKFNNLPVIVYTNTYTAADDRDLAFTLGADEYIIKPATAEEICAALMRATYKAHTQTGRREPKPMAEPVMKQYANVLVQKLQKKNIELERARTELEKTNAGLEERVRDRTARLEAINKELDSFCYSISHDLRAPLRGIKGFAECLNESRDRLDPEAQSHLDHIVHCTERMGQLIDDLLSLSFASRVDLDIRKVNLTSLALQVVKNLRQREPGRRAEIVIKENLTTQADLRLALIALENLIGNAWKYTSKTSSPWIEFGVVNHDEAGELFYVRDNGAGFDMEYAGKLFGPFQRMHSNDEFPGHGVGLSTVQRIVNRHGGKIWAEAKVNEGATFYFSFSNNQDRTARADREKNVRP